jgi:HSP20 family protein
MDLHAQEDFTGNEAAPQGGLADAAAPGVGCDQTSEAQEPAGNLLARDPHLWHRRLGGGNFGPLIADASPFAPMAQLCTRRERVMTRFYRRCALSPDFSSGPPSGNEGAVASERAETAPVEWAPSVNVRESGDSIFISVDLSGVRKEDVQIKAGEEGIAISAERRAGREAIVDGTDPRLRVAEWSHRGFHRIIPLPQTALIEAARAGLHEGVLEITIPLQQNRRSRQIEIEC